MEANSALAEKLMEESMAEMEAMQGIQGLGYPKTMSANAGGERDDEHLTR